MATPAMVHAAQGMPLPGSSSTDSAAGPASAPEASVVAGTGLSASEVSATAVVVADSLPIVVVVTIAVSGASAGGAPRRSRR